MSCKYRIMLPLSLLLLTAQTAHALEVRDARTPEPPQGAPVLAGYMHLHNPHDEPVRLEGASSADFARIELHDTEVEDDMARMFEIDQIHVPPGGEVAFQPRGKHLMLFTPAREFGVGADFTVTLEFSSGHQEVTFTVVDRAEVELSGEGDHGDGHEHGGH